MSLSMLSRSWRLRLALLWSVTLFFAARADAALEREPYLQMVSPTSVTLAWRTVEAADSRVQYGRTLALESEESDAAVVNDHFITLTGLSPATTYFYNIGSTTAVEAGGTDEYFFTTAPTAGAAVPFTAWILGDSGTGFSAQAAVRDAMVTYFGESRPDLLLHVGDMAYDDGTDQEFTDNFFSIYENTLRTTPVWPAMGNHELPTSDSPSQTGPYFEAFVLPTAAELGGAASGTEAFYSFDYANVHFIVIDTADTSMSLGSAMANWLMDDLIATTQPWLVAYFHHPPYSKGSHDSDNGSDSGGRLRLARENIVPILEAGGVDLVLTGHSHSYERSFLVNGVHCPSCGPDPDFATPDFATLDASGRILDSGSGDPNIDAAYVKPAGLVANSGTVYVVAGHGGQNTRLEGVHPIMYFAEGENGSCLMTVDGDTLTLVNVRRDGVVSDAFTLTKGADPCASDGDCDDGVACTTDTCDGASGECSNTPSDGSCDDGIACTTDTCDVGAGGCTNEADPSACADDGLFCNGTEVCDVDTGCVSAGAPDCSSFDDSCATGVCNEEADTCEGQPSNEGQTCDQGDGVCTFDSICTAGECVPSTACHPVCEYCDSGACRDLCGNPIDPANDTRTVADGLKTLRVAVGVDTCDSCLCDVDDSGAVTATDALILLQFAVGLPLQLSCPAAS